MNAKKQPIRAHRTANLSPPQKAITSTSFSAMNARNRRQRITDSFAAATYIPRNSLGVIPAANIEKKKEKRKKERVYRKVETERRIRHNLNTAFPGALSSSTARVKGCYPTRMSPPVARPWKRSKEGSGRQRRSLRTSLPSNPPGN